MQFGVFVPQGWRMDLVELADPVEQWEAMTAVARAADAGPWDSIWLFDHFHTVPEPARETVFEAWTATAALARDTQRVKLGQMVGCNGYRNPALYAKMAGTVDVASHGRLYAGLGAGWAEDEWTAYGYPWSSLKDRMGSFRESVELIHRLWTEEDVVFHGRYHSVDKPYVEPRRKPPLWIGGGGEQVTLKLVAQYADACNFGTGQVDVIEHKLSVLRQHCDSVGRDYDEIVKSTSLNLFPISRGADPVSATATARGRYGVEEFREIGAGGGVGLADILTTGEIRSRLERLEEIGVQYVIFYIPGVAYDHDPLHLLASDVVPAFS